MDPISDRNTKTETSRRPGQLGTERTQTERAVSEGDGRKGKGKKNASEKQSMKKPKIILQSTPIADENSDSWSENSYESTDLDVKYDSLDEEMDNEVILSRIRRLGNQKTIWKNDKEFYCIALGYLISPDAIISSVYGMRRFGVNLVTPITLAALFIAFPVMFLELALGQFTSASSYSVFKFMAPAFSGLSALMSVMNLTMLLNDFIIFGMTLTLVKDSLISVSRLTSCSNTWNDIACQNAINPCEQLHQLTGTAYVAIQGRCVQKRWYTDVMREDIATNNTIRQISPAFQYLVSHLSSTGQNGTEARVFPSDLLLVLSSAIFGLILLAYRLPPRSIVYFSKITLSVIFAFLATVVFTTISSDYKNFVAFPLDYKDVQWASQDLACWTVAHTLLVSKIGQGGLIVLGSQNPFRSNIFKHTCILMIVAFLIPHTIGHLVYPFMDNMLWRTVQDYNLFEEKKDGYYAAHRGGFNTIWADTMAAFYSEVNQGKTFGNLFFFMIVCIFLTHKIIRIRTLLLPAIERFGIDVKIDLEIIRRLYLVCVFLVFWLKYLIPHKTEAFYATVSGASIVVFYEIVCVFGFYGPRRFLSNLNLMMFGVIRNSKQDAIRTRIRQIYNLCVVGIFSAFVCVVPIYLLVLVFASCLRYVQSGGNVVIACGFPLFFFTFVPAVAAVKMYKCRQRQQLIANLFKPMANLWGPREEHDRKRAENEERQLRI